MFTLVCTFLFQKRVEASIFVFIFYKKNSTEQVLRGTLEKQNCEHQEKKTSGKGRRRDETG